MIQPIASTNYLSFNGIYSGKKHCLNESTKISQPIKDKLILPLKEKTAQKFTKENVQKTGKEILQTLKKTGTKIKSALKEYNTPLTAEEIEAEQKAADIIKIIALLGLFAAELLFIVGPMVAIYIKIKSLFN